MKHLCSALSSTSSPVVLNAVVIVVIKKLRFMAKSSNLDQAALARSQRKMFVTVSAILAAWIICWLPLMCVLLLITGAQAAQIELDVAQFVTLCSIMWRSCRMGTHFSTPFCTFSPVLTSEKLDFCCSGVSQMNEQKHLLQQIQLLLECKNERDMKCSSRDPNSRPYVIKVS